MSCVRGVGDEAAIEGQSIVCLSGGKAYADSIFVNDPQLTAKRSFTQRANETGADGENMRLVLAFQAKHDDSGMMCGRVILDIRKPAIESDEYALLFITHS
jgi:hypothetical protein